ncbi:MAG: YlxR family protein [Actinomycetota bacterium]
MPIRTCAGCRTRRSQDELLRVVRRPDGSARVDLPGTGDRASRRRERGRMPGRGAYLCRDRSCMQRALESGSLARALRIQGALGTEFLSELRRTIETPSGAAGRSNRRESDGEAQGSRGR